MQRFHVQQMQRVHVQQMQQCHVQQCHAQHQRAASTEAAAVRNGHVPSTSHDAEAKRHEIGSCCALTHRSASSSLTVRHGDPTPQICVRFHSADGKTHCAPMP
jgi:hypothetical protein